MKRLHLGISLFFAKNTLVYARDVSPKDVERAQGVIAGLAFFGFRNGLKIGSGILSGTIVANLEDK